MPGPTPTNLTPTPTAVPWTPDMAAGRAPAAGAETQPTTVSSPPHAPTPPQTPAPQLSPLPMAPQPNYAQPARPEAFPSQAGVQPPMQHGQPVPIQPSGQSVHPHQAHPYNGPVQPPAQPPAYQHAQQMNQARYVPPAQAPHYAQAGPPPMLPPQMQAPMPFMTGQNPSADGKPNSLLAKILKRSPKPEAIDLMSEAPAATTSLFNKNFVLGGIAGFIGAVALMTGLNSFTAETPQRTQQVAVQPASSNLVPAPQPSSAATGQNRPTSNAADGDTFLDTAIATDRP